MHFFDTIKFTACRTKMSKSPKTGLCPSGDTIALMRKIFRAAADVFREQITKTPPRATPSADHPSS